MNPERLMTTILAPHVSEKSTSVADKHRQFVFQVRKEASKQEIRKAVETLFEVKVTDVHVVNVKGKRKRFGALEGRRPGWKKAYVTLAEGEDIDFLGPQ